MENVGSQWLEAAQLKQQDSAIKMCAWLLLSLHSLRRYALKRSGLEILPGTT